MRIKRLYIYIIKTFLPLLAVSFAISWFVVVMQLLWRYVNDLVGKGIDAMVFLELMFYASMTVVPLSMILAILVASLMTFGNLGERLELLAMKAAGVPLYTIMKPVFASVVVVALGLFIFQNDWMIKSQVKFWTYYFSIQNKSPELAIPAGVFYKDLAGYSIYIREKDPDTNLLKGLMIYDYKNGFSNAMVIVADSGRIYSTKKNDALVLEMYHGESFQNLRNSYDAQDLIPYMREKFELKKVHINFDANLNMVDEEILSSQFIGKNILELDAYTDSLRVVVDSLEVVLAREVLATSHLRHFDPSLFPTTEPELSVTDEGAILDLTSISQSADTFQQEIPVKHQVDERGATSFLPITAAPSQWDSLTEEERSHLSLKQRIAHMGLQERSMLYQRTEENIAAKLSNSFFSRANREENSSLMRKNLFEFHRKMTFPVACIVFFFIGAPLGAIIRKGGIGTPIVVAVLFFIVYYTLESVGLKMASNGKWYVWTGLWTPSLLLAPVGLWLSYIATKDSAKLNMDSYIIYLRKVLGASLTRKVEYKSVVMENADYSRARRDVEQLSAEATQLIDLGRLSYPHYFLTTGHSQLTQAVAQRTETIVDNLSNTRDYLLVNRLANYPILRTLPQPSPSRRWNIAMMLVFPIGLPLYLLYWLRHKAYERELRQIIQTNQQVLELLPPQ